MPTLILGGVVVVALAAGVVFTIAVGASWLSTWLRAQEDKRAERKRAKWLADERARKETDQ